MPWYWLPFAMLLSESPADDASSRLLAAHNRVRAEASAPPMRWNESLARDAAAWAGQLAQRGKFEHAEQESQGENLWMGTHGRWTLESMVGGWASERQFFKPGRFPDVSTTGNWADVGHYTQMIWPATGELGCAIATGGGNDFLVCRYGPAGNIEGELLQPAYVVADAPKTSVKKRKPRKRR